MATLRPFRRAGAAGDELTTTCSGALPGFQHKHLQRFARAADEEPRGLARVGSEHRGGAQLPC
jgi:hypothetical protein